MSKKAAKSKKSEKSGLDPVTYQVVRNRLIAASDEMRIALQKVSGSPTVTEASDYFTGLFLADGTFATMGFQVTFVGPPISQSIDYLLKRKEVPINDGDMFALNDPWIGALHQNDLQLAGPIFWKGKVVAWAGVMAHQTDIGGMDFASWCPKAKEVFQEGLRIPGVKIVDKGEVRQDIVDMILSASRLPAYLGLDLRAFIATINVARDRFTDIIRQFGLDTVMQALDRILDISEAQLRERLRELPDGEVRATNYIDHDGHKNDLYRIDLHLTKKGDNLTFDFSNSSKQAPGFINCTRAGLYGAVIGASMPTLSWDVPWNAGLARPIEIKAPDGLVVTAQRPAPVGAATVEAVWTTAHLVMGALNKLLACSPKYASRAQAVSVGAMATFNLGGINRFGERYGFHSIDPHAGGTGAYASKDGYNCGGPVNSPMPAIADVETTERWAPLHYLHRRIAPDSGGVGRMRGGNGIEFAVKLGHVREADALIMTHGVEVPNASGTAGGWPGATIVQRFGRNAMKDGHYPKAALPDDPRDLGGDWQDFGPKPGLMPMSYQDVYLTASQGGGGLGDPLDRDPAQVAADVETGMATKRNAEKNYGVIVKRGKVDAAATSALRAKMRAERIGKTPTRDANGNGADDGAWPLGDGLSVAEENGTWRTSCKCGHTLTTGTTAWRSHAAAKTLTPVKTGAPMKLHRELEARGYYCPSCARQLAVDILEKKVAVQDDIVLDLATVGRLSAR